MQESPKKFVDFYSDGEKQVALEVDTPTIRWMVYNMLAGYLNKLKDRERVTARGSDRIEVRGQISILSILGAQLLEIADAMDKGPPEEFTVKLVES